MINISILIPTYNEEATIIPLLKSVKKETAKIKSVSFEIVVIDDLADRLHDCDVLIDQT